MEVDGLAANQFETLVLFAQQVRHWHFYVIHHDESCSGTFGVGGAHLSRRDALTAFHQEQRNAWYVIFLFALCSSEDWKYHYCS